ncbi:MAG: cellulase [Acidobacteria bacterium]|nr:cellulase [Acidobacteriota bacterium]
MMAAIAALQLGATESWDLWERYATRFMSGGGRVIDPGIRNGTTSEGQAYAMFFALVANDRKRFAQLLDWTEKNLAGGDLGSHLPSWSWGESAGGRWGVLDDNSASDADLWMAYSLLEAGRHWNEARFSALGRRLAGRIASSEVEHLPHLGTVLLPGYRDFKTGDRIFFNVSYLPVQVLSGIAAHCPTGPWRNLAGNVPRLVKASSPRALALDWSCYRSGPGFVIEAPDGKKAVASYDAIRVYLWAGMLPKEVPVQAELLRSLSGMARIVAHRSIPPAIVDSDGVIRNEHSSIGFSAALIPFFAARGEDHLAARQQHRVNAAFNRATGLYGATPAYYDHNLILFSNGWLEKRYRFDSDGGLRIRRNTE